MFFSTHMLCHGKFFKQQTSEVLALDIFKNKTKLRVQKSLENVNNETIRYTKLESVIQN
jgi:hypothetical protein